MLSGALSPRAVRHPQPESAGAALVVLEPATLGMPAPEEALPPAAGDPALPALEYDVPP